MSMDFERLKDAEKDWCLTEEQRQRIAENCLNPQKRRPSKKIAGWITAGAGVVATAAVILLVVLFRPPVQPPDAGDTSYQCPQEYCNVQIYEDQVIHDFGEPGCIYRTIFGTDQRELLAEEATFLTVAEDKLLFTRKGWLCSIDLDGKPRIKKLKKYTAYYNCMAVWDGYALMQSRDFENGIFYADLINLKNMKVKRYELDCYISNVTWLDGAVYYVERPNDPSTKEQRVMVYSIEDKKSELLFTHKIPDHWADFFKADQRLYFFDHENVMCYDLESSQKKSLFENAYLNNPQTSTAYYNGKIYVNDRGMENRLWIYDIEKQEVVSYDPIRSYMFYYSDCGVMYSYDFRYTTMISEEKIFTFDNRQIKHEKPDYSNTYGGTVGNQGYVRVDGNAMIFVSGPNDYTVMYRN